MLTRLLLFVFAATFLSSCATYEVYNRVENPVAKKGERFTFLETSKDTQKLKFVATYKGISKLSYSQIAEAFDLIKANAQSYGANCFILRTYGKDNGGKVFFTMNTYYAPDDFISNHTFKGTSNTVYLIASGKTGGKRKSRLKINGAKNQLPGGTYATITLKDGKETKISKGSFAGTSMTLNYEKKKPAVFLVMRGVGLDPVEEQITSPGIRFHLGRLNRVDPNLGMVLTMLLDEGSLQEH